MSSAAKTKSTQAAPRQPLVPVRTLVATALVALAAVAGGVFATALTMRSAADAQMAPRAATVRQLAAVRLRTGGGAFRRSLERGTALAGARVALVPAGAAIPPRMASEGTAVRTFAYPIPGVSVPRARLIVELPSAPLHDALMTAALRAAAVAAVMLAILVLSLRALLQRDVAEPLAGLARTIERLRGGAYSERVSVRGPAAVRAVAAGLDGLATVLADLDAQAATDPLTGIANRRLFHTALTTELKRSQRESSPLALVLLDLDGFKEINDSRGHPFGDGILQTVARRLREAVRATDILARVGGDEFAILLPGLTSARALEIVERARENTSAAIGGLEITWCAGVADYPSDASDGRTLLECADVALYCAKSACTPCSCVYDPANGTTSRTNADRTTIEELLTLPDAVVPVFQPLVALATGRVAGYEALARFPYPPARRPDEWFALAQSCGLGPELEAAAARAALAVGGRPAGTYLSFNLSASALSADAVLEVLPADLTDIVIEITENERIADDEVLVARLAPLRARGARIAIDDAGAGYSGLQQVMRIQPDIIKLDRSLVANVDSDPAKAALIDSFVRFAGRTGAVVCAEGIETPEELKVLADLDVTYGQGFGLARPAPPWASVSAWVAGTVRGTRADSAGAAERQENGDLRLAHLTARLANVRDLGQLADLTEVIASELGADEVALLRRADREAALEAISSHPWMPARRKLELSHYPTMRRLLTSQDLVQVLLSDGTADLGELALLGQSRHASMLLTPVVAHGETVGVMQAFSTAERAWTRAETSRARIIAHQIGPLFERGVFDSALIGA